MTDTSIVTGIGVTALTLVDVHAGWVHLTRRFVALRAGTGVSKDFVHWVTLTREGATHAIFVTAGVSGCLEVKNGAIMSSLLCDLARFNRDVLWL